MPEWIWFLHLNKLPVTIINSEIISGNVKFKFKTGQIFPHLYKYDLVKSLFNFSQFAV